MYVSSLAPPSKILKTVKKNASQGAILRLPENPSFKRALNKAKNKENPVPPAPTTLDDIVLDPTEIKSFRGEPMLLHDNSNHRRLIMFGTQKNLDQLLRCPSWYIDSTFSSSPELFYQLLTIHGEIPDHHSGNPWIFPLIYILLTKKDTDIYIFIICLLYICLICLNKNYRHLASRIFITKHTP